ncbi:hypothetical protein BH24ACT9_BH24ACT9_15070 [soil metagenome]
MVEAPRTGLACAGTAWDGHSQAGGAVSESHLDPAKEKVESASERLGGAGRQPKLRPYRPLTDAAYDRLVVHITRSLGAAEIEPTSTEETA